MKHARRLTKRVWVQIVASAESLGISSSLARALCTAAAAGEVPHCSRAALPLVLHAACAFTGVADGLRASGMKSSGLLAQLLGLYLIFFHFHAPVMDLI